MMKLFESFRADPLHNRFTAKPNDPHIKPAKGYSGIAGSVLMQWFFGLFQSFFIKEMGVFFICSFDMFLQPITQEIHHLYG